MAFKKTIKQSSVIKDPESLFRDLRSRSVEGLLSQQADTLRAYLAHQTHRDIALELPIGSGKTLVGLLIAEWRRRTNNERALFLCPTRQLVKQVVEQSKTKYGIDVLDFSGSSRNFDSRDKSSFLNAEKVGVATYSALFNSNSFFNDIGIIIFDDAHAADNYVSKCWSIEINRYENEELFSSIQNLIKNNLSENDKSRFERDENSPIDAQWVNMLPFPIWIEKILSIISIFDTYCECDCVRYRWPMLRDHLHSCNLYYSSNSFLIRPIAPPTEFFSPFSNSNQRVYMSATLGQGCDLERIFNNNNIIRIPAPEGWDKQGIGRKFFVFPQRIWDENTSYSKSIEWINKFGRAAILVPSSREANMFLEYSSQILGEKGFIGFDGKDIESNKHIFVNKPQAYMVLANRYDGIDFNGDECRYLIVHGLPQSTNLQEKFLLTRLNLNILYHDRIKTRVTQAVGRCTRSATDYAMVVVLGDQMTGYFSKPENRKYFHPEFQAEVEFGLEQSDSEMVNDLEENIDHFISQNLEWENAEEDIWDTRDEINVQEYQGTDILSEIVSNEVKYHNALWCKDYDKAFDISQKVLLKLVGKHMQGYRSWWLYLSGNAAFMSINLNHRAVEFYKKAAGAQPMLPWLRNLPSLLLQKVEHQKQSVDDALLSALENLSFEIEKHGNSEHQIHKMSKEILSNLSQNDSNHFELGQVLLGQLLGYTAENAEYDGAPDPWWIISDSKGIVFEDYTDIGNLAAVPKNKVLQAKGHPDTLSEKYPQIKFTPIFCSGTQQFHESALSHSSDLGFMSQIDMINFAKVAIHIITDLWRTYSSENKMDWLKRATSLYNEKCLGPDGLIQGLMVRTRDEFKL